MFALKNGISHQARNTHPLSPPLKAALLVAAVAIFGLAAQSSRVSTSPGRSEVASTAAVDAALPAPGAAEVSPSPGSKTSAVAWFNAYGEALGAAE